ncbi:hypothetical protein N7509_000689 [Penicillium cosmopolitanum]|uniref:Uncharacterized protein n=1 Tax=Penicillium cosmopolitanum TaxID=1131564 RepID=A0A9X0BEB5_9EURO|nr:uncharacterized protein N7509_000689 [Penicillium cosmopolitanum]KAJ5414062.1 hypothetical protein N7509_000689 [Penicillium cosmopolitanum]
MPSASTISGYTYENWGPVTTTFTPPASCATASNKIEVGPSDSSRPIFRYGLQCETVGGWECYPSATIETTTTPDTNPTQFFKAHYYSPGLYCPADWVTVGVASWDGDGDKSLITSGVLAPPTTAEIVQRDGEVFLGILDKSETAVICCPRSYSADVQYGCWSTISDYKPSSACNWEIPKVDWLGSSSIKTTINGTATTRYLQTLAGTSPFIGPATTTFDAEDKKTLVGMAVNPMLTLIHKKADFDGM